MLAAPHPSSLPGTLDGIADAIGVVMVHRDSSWHHSTTRWQGRPASQWRGLPAHDPRSLRPARPQTDEDSGSTGRVTVAFAVVAGTAMAIIQIIVHITGM